VPIYHQHQNKNNSGGLLLLYIFVLFICSMNFEPNILLYNKIALTTEISSIALYHFYIYKRRFSMFFIFILGIWNDAILNITLGASSLCYFLVIVVFLFFENITLKKIDRKTIYAKSFIFMAIYSFLKYLILNITGDISSSYHLISMAIFSFIIYFLLLAHFFEYIDKKIFKNEHNY
jgi:hypothetical protein